MISVSLYSTKAFLFCLLSGQLVHSLFLFFFINTLLSSMLKKKKEKEKSLYSRSSQYCSLFIGNLIFYMLLIHFFFIVLWFSLLAYFLDTRYYLMNYKNRSVRALAWFEIKTFHLKHLTIRSQEG